MATKLQHLRKVYTYDNGETGRSAKPNWETLTFELLGPKQEGDESAPVVDEFIVDRKTVNEEIAVCAIGHGISQKMGDDQSGIAKKAKDDGVQYDPVRGYADFIKERLEAMWENFSAGVWVAEGESASGAGSVTILLDAICRVYAGAGQELDEAQVAALRVGLKDEKTRDQMKARADVGLKIEEIKQERQKARLEKAAAAAAEADEGSLDDLLNLG